MIFVRAREDGLNVCPSLWSYAFINVSSFSATSSGVSITYACPLAIMLVYFVDHAQGSSADMS